MFIFFLLLAVCLCVGIGVWFLGRRLGQLEDSVRPVQYQRDGGTVRYPSEKPAPKPAPEISCFVKGIIRSMRETPDEWARQDHAYRWGHVCHSSPGGIDLVVYVYNEEAKHRCIVIGHADTMTKEETAVLYADGVAFLERREKEKADAQRAAARAPWEKLGCPDNQSS